MLCCCWLVMILLQVGKKFMIWRKLPIRWRNPCKLHQRPESTVLRLLYGLAVVFLKYNKFVWLTNYSRGLSTNLVVKLHNDPSRLLISAVHSMDTIVREVPTWKDLCSHWCYKNYRSTQCHFSYWILTELNSWITTSIESRHETLATKVNAYARGKKLSHDPH